MRAVTVGPSFFPSPGATAERVNTYYVEIDAPAAGYDQRVSYEGVSDHQVREFNVSQLLRAYKVGGLVDVRLEIAAYELMARLGDDPGPWIEQSVTPAALAADAVPLTGWPELESQLDRRAFSPLTDTRPSYLEFRHGSFAEYSWAHQELRTWELEYFVPRQRSTNTVAVAPVAKADGHWCLGVERRDLAPVQHLTGKSGVLTVPAWHLPINTAGDRAARAYVTTALNEHYACQVSDLMSLGGAYFPSPGLSPEFVMPLLAVVVNPRDAKLAWLPIDELLTHRADLHDGHLLVTLWRAWQMSRDQA